MTTPEALDRGSTPLDRDLLLRERSDARTALQGEQQNATRKQERWVKNSRCARATDA
jgi:hypothetical protein